MLVVQMRPFRCHELITKLVVDFPNFVTFSWYLNLKCPNAWYETSILRGFYSIENEAIAVCVPVKIWLNHDSQKNNVFVTLRWEISNREFYARIVFIPNYFLRLLTALLKFQVLAVTSLFNLLFIMKISQG